MRLNIIDSTKLFLDSSTRIPTKLYLLATSMKVLLFGERHHRSPQLPCNPFCVFFWNTTSASSRRLPTVFKAVQLKKTGSHHPIYSAFECSKHEGAQCKRGLLCYHIFEEQTVAFHAILYPSPDQEMQAIFVLMLVACLFVNFHLLMQCNVMGNKNRERYRKDERMKNNYEKRSTLLIQKNV